MDGEPIEVIAGATTQRFLVFRTGDGSPLGGYSADTPLSVLLWAGEDQAAITPGLEVAWDEEGDDETGPFERAILTVPGASTLALAPGPYDYLVEVVVGGEAAPACKGSIEVIGRPGAAAGPYTLTTYRMMRSLYPGIQDMRDEEADLAGFARQRSLATAEFLRLIIERYNPRPGYNLRRSATFDPVHGYEAQDKATAPPTVAQLRAALAAGGLVVDPPDDEIVGLIVARLAVFYVLDRQGASYVQDAQGMRIRGLLELDGYRAYVDLDDDGVADVLIHKGCTFLGEAP